MTTPRQGLDAPLELRVIIYDHLIPLEVDLPSPLPAGISALLVTSKQTRSEVLSRLWRIPNVSWQGSFTSTTWTKFRRIAIPHIRDLTIVVHNEPKSSWFMDNEFHQLLQWMCRRSKSGLRARYPWALENLTLRDVPHALISWWPWWCSVSRSWYCDDKSWRMRHECGVDLKWRLSQYEKILIEKLRGCGVKVMVKRQTVCME